jgi:hypothetical protein
MNQHKEDGARARVLAAALRTWAQVDPDPTPVAARFDVRQPPAWGHVATIDLGQQQHRKLIAFMRDDLATRTPGYGTPERAESVIHGLITELAAAGARYVTTADLVEAGTRIGRSRTWIAEHIGHLIDAGHLTETRRPDRYRIA